MSTAAMPNRQKNNRDKGRAHITNRTGYGNANSHRKDGPDHETSTVPSTPVSGVYRDPRTAYMLCSVLGARTTVKTRNGKRYKGTITGFSVEGDIALSDAKLDNEDNLQDAQLPGIVLPRDTVISCMARGVDLKGLSIGASDFTDSGITSRLNGNADGVMKELEPWIDDGAELTTSSLMLDENQKGWEPSEMFQVNSEKFNVQSSYSEDLDGYTTPKVTPNSEGYEEREKMAAKQAEEIERSDVYKARIAKELSETSEEAKYASVEAAPNSRAYEGHGGGGKNAYTIPALRDGDQNNMRNNNSMGRGQGRTLQRQNSPYSSASANHSQAHPSSHQSMQNSRHHLNNHYHPGPHQGPPPGRNQGPHQRQQQHSPSPSHGHPSHHHPHHHPQGPPHPLQQQPPPSHPSSQPPMQQPQSSQPHQQQQQQQRPSQTHPQLVSKAPQPGMPPMQSQAHIQKAGHPHHNLAASKGAMPLNGQPMPVNTRPPINPQHINGDAKPGHMDVNSLSQKPGKPEVSAAAPPQVRADISTHKPNPLSSQMSQPSMPPRVTESTAVPVVCMTDSKSQPPMGAPTPVVSSAQPVSHDRRNNRGDSKIKVNKELQDFSKNFVLNATGTPDSSRSEASETVEDNSTSSSSMSSSSIHPLTSSPSSANTESVSSSLSSDQAAAVSSKATEKSDETSPSTSASTGIGQSKLNPLAKEFTPSAKAPVASEAQSPSPQQRVSPQVVPHQMIPTFSPSIYGYVPGVGLPQGVGMAAPLQTAGVVPIQTQNKRATVSIGGRMTDLAAHQAHHVTGQPLLATSPQMMYMPSGQSGGYQVLNIGNHGSRMVAPGSFTGQPGPIDPANPQAQPQPVFLTGQQQPMPAHLTQHPQPAHGQAHVPTPSGNPTAQPTHVPNPAPSPVQHQPQQQTAQQYGGQAMAHHLSQGPPQSANPQVNYPPMSLHHNLSSMPRTSMAGQHGMAQSGHPSVSMSFPLSTPHSFPNASPAQYTFSPAAQPQTSHNSSHQAGHQPHYVVMPHPHPPPHHQPTMQQQHHGQAYATTGIQFQSGHNIVQGPSPMPPSHTPNPSPGAPHIIHQGMQAMQAGIHQQVPGTPSGMFMQVPSTLHQFQHQQ